MYKRTCVVGTARAVGLFRDLDAAEEAVSEHEEATEDLQEAVGETTKKDSVAQAPGGEVTSSDVEG
mgnify:CR=1 FL=1